MQRPLDIINNSLKSTFKSHTAEVQACIDNCFECYRACEQLIPYCLGQGGEHSGRHHILSLLTCADMCRTAGHFMMWNSDLHTKACGLCTEVCRRCAEDCESMADDKLMQACADICKKCADSCKKMATHH